MNDHDKQSLDQRLAAWNVSLQPDPALAGRVLERVAALAGGQPAAGRGGLHLRWAATTALAAAVLLGVFFASQGLERHRLLRDGGYCLLIDPVYRAHAAVQDGPGLPSADPSASYLDRLAWMQDRLDLSREQFLELVGLHTQYAGQFNGLYEELVRLEGRYGEFEDLRRQDGVIDFIALYEVLLERRSVEGRSGAVSGEFVAKALAILNPGQRPAYLALVQRSFPHRNG